MNLSNSILSKFGAPTVGKTLPLVDNLLKKDYKNVVILLLDGLGTCIMEGNLKEDGFLRTHFIESISTVFPPTTVAATTSVMSGLQPIEHAWLGWDCYYPQVDKNITVFLNTEVYFTHNNRMRKIRNRESENHGIDLMKIAE